jgi:hypothetical protein
VSVMAWVCHKGVSVKTLDLGHKQGRFLAGAEQGRQRRGDKAKTSQRQARDYPKERSSSFSFLCVRLFQWK